MPRYPLAIAVALVLFPAPAVTQAVCPGPSSRDPAWSPDGSRIVFSSHRGGRAELWTIDVKTHALVQLTKGGGDAYYPRYSPDGTRIAFTVMAPAGQRVGIVGAGGGPVRTVTDSADNAADPEWLPDGRLVYSSERGGLRDLWLADGQGRHAAPLFRLEGEEWAPRVSPSGNRLLFQTDGGGNYDVYVARLDGTERRLIAGGPGFQGLASWSPDETMVAYYTRAPADSSGRPAWNTAEIMVVSAAGGTPRPLTQNETRDQSPAWSPDGRTIAWTSCGSGNLEVWLMDTDGHNPRQLTRTTAAKQE